MPFIELPTKEDDSIGREKSDRTVATDLDYEVSAAEFEALKDAVIECAETIGLYDGSTSGSIEERLNGNAEIPGLQVGNLSASEDISGTGTIVAYETVDGLSGTLTAFGLKVEGTPALTIGEPEYLAAAPEAGVPSTVIATEGINITTETTATGFNVSGIGADADFTINATTDLRLTTTAGGSIIEATHGAYNEGVNRETTSNLTTSTTPVLLFTISPPAGYGGWLHVRAQGLGPSGTVQGYYMRSAYMKNVGGVATLSAVAVIASAETDAGLDLTVTASGADILVHAVGIAATNMFWSAALEYQLMSMPGA
jgi:hypothetical protein